MSEMETPAEWVLGNFGGNSELFIDPDAIYYRITFLEAQIAKAREALRIDEKEFSYERRFEFESYLVRKMNEANAVLSEGSKSNG